MDFISSELRDFLQTPAGNRVLRMLTPGISKQNRRDLKNRLLNPPETFQKLIDFKAELEKTYIMYQIIEDEKPRKSIR